MSKKIIIDLRLLGKGGTSGIEEYTHALVAELLRIDQKNSFLFFYNGFRKVSLPLDWLGVREIYAGKIPNKFLDIASRFLNFPKVENFLAGDLVFSPHFNIIATDLPRIVTFHDLSFIHHPNFFSARQRFWHWLQNAEATAKNAGEIIAVSEFTKSDLVELFHIKPEKIKVIYSGINKVFQKLPSGNIEMERFRGKFKLHRPFILYLGTIEPRKNVISIIRAFNVLRQDNAYKDFELVIAGQPGWLYEETLAEAGHSPVKEYIKFLGRILPEERVYLYNLARIFVYPSFFEGFGFPPLEAQACGVPVIASNRTSLPEVLGKSAILVNPWKLDQILSGMQTLINDGEKRKQLILAGFENIEKFTWGRAATETARLW
ncbi:MAG TPA: glycosyltransferase family 1 protein [Candidatus Paceibacterota bacterium]